MQHRQAVLSKLIIISSMKGSKLEGGTHRFMLVLSMAVYIMSCSRPFMAICLCLSTFSGSVSLAFFRNYRLKEVKG